MACKPAFHAYNAILDSFFYACSDIVGSFFLLKNTTYRSIIVD